MSTMLIVEELIALPKIERQKHLDLSESCLERGGISTQHRGVLVEFLKTNFPVGNKIHLCHACNNDKCSNPKHLYWGTAKENVDDAKANGTHKTMWQRMIEKHGLDKARELQSRKAERMNAVLAAEKRQGNPGRQKTAEHKRKISEALTRV